MSADQDRQDAGADAAADAAAARIKQRIRTMTVEELWEVVEDFWRARDSDAWDRHLLAWVAEDLETVGGSQR